MPALNLTAKTHEEQKIKIYLEANASDTLAEKINNAVRIQKDGKTLINKKTLSGFMAFACGEARKQAEKGANSACIDDETVYGWAIHYFEEDSNEGTLYNEDGTEYKIQPNPSAKAPTANYTPPKPRPKPQLSMFDMLENNDNSDISATQPEDSEEQDEEPTEEELEQIYGQIQQEPEQKTENNQRPQGSPLYRRYMDVQEKYPQAVIAMRLGDFYEMFGENAKVLAQELDLTLTGRDCGLDERVPMVGFPYHAADTYFKKVSGKGHCIVVIENDGIREFNVDLETGEILHAQEQEEPVPTVSDLLSDYAEEQPANKQLERDIAAVMDDEDDFDVSAFDAGAVAILSELLGDEITLR